MTAVPVLPVRDGCRDDLARVLALNNAAVPAVNRLDGEQLARLVALATAFRVAHRGERVVGFLLGLEGPDAVYESVNYAWFRRRYDRFLYVDRVVVAPEAHRRGLGRRFYDDLVGIGRERGIGHLCAEVNTRPRNDDSLAFHDALGFVAVGSQDTEGGTKTVRLYHRAIDGSAS